MALREESLKGKSSEQQIALQKGTKSEKKWQLIFSLVFKT